MTLFKGQRLRAHFTKLSVGKGARPCMSSSAESAMLELMEQEEKESASKQLRLTYFISDEERINKLQVEAFADNRIMLHVASSPSFRSYIDAVARSGKPYHLSRQRLSGPVLDQAVEERRQSSHQWLSGVEIGTLCVDGWTSNDGKEWASIMFCSEGREVLVDLLPITAEGSKDTIHSQRLLEGGIRAVGALIARYKNASETDPSAAKIVRQITTDNAPGLLAAKINISNEAKGHVVQDHCLLHACNNMLKEVFTIPEAKATLLAVLECIKELRKPRTKRKYALVREQWNAEVRNSRKLRKQLQLGEDASLRNQLMLLPKEGTCTALKLSLPSETRFASNFQAMETYVNNLPIIKRIILSGDDVELSAVHGKISEELLKELVSGLEPLYALLRLGDSSKAGGLSKAHARFLAIDAHLKEKATKSDLWTRVHAIFTKRWKQERTGWHRPHHVLAYVTDPEFWGDIDTQSYDERQEMLACLREALRSWCGCTPLTPGWSVDIHREEEIFFEDCWRELLKFLNPANRVARDGGWGESTLAQRSRAMEMSTSQFWRELTPGPSIPNLARVAVEISCLTPSAASPERVWSRAGWICDRRRANLDMDRIRKLVMLKMDVSAKNDVVSFHRWGGDPLPHDSDDHDNDSMTDDDLDTLELSTGRGVAAL